MMPRAIAPPRSAGLAGNVPLALLVPLRLYIGWFFLKAGLAKTSSLLGPGDLASTLAGWASTNPHPFYKSFLSTQGQTYAGLLSYLVAYGEIAVGVLLLSGLLTRLACLGGLFLIANYYLASAHVSWIHAGLDEVFAVALVTLAVAGAGRVAGLDTRLYARAPTFPFTLVY